MFGGMAFFELVSKFVPEPDVSALTGVESGHGHGHSHGASKDSKDGKKKKGDDSKASSGSSKDPKKQNLQEV